MKDWTGQIENWDQMIKSGQGTQVKAKLKLLKTTAIPRNMAVDVAQLGRRVGMSQFGTRVLYPYVRPQKQLNIVPSDEEKCEYAACLSDIGAVWEAERILKHLIGPALPEAAIAYALSLFKEWDYYQAIPILKNYIQWIENPYKKMVGKVNLAAAYLNSKKLHLAKDLVDQLLIESEQSQLSLLYGNCLELAGQICLSMGQMSEARNQFERSKKLLAPTKNLAMFYTEKWLAVLQAIESGGQNLKLMFKLRTRCAEYGMWEVIRDCDHQLAVATEDVDLYHRVYYGSPFSTYREYIRHRFSPELNSVYRYFINKKKKEPVLDVHYGTFSNSNITIKPGQMLHRLLRVFASDFYSPFGFGFLFAKVFPQEFYDPFSSPDRIYKGIQRLRQEFAKADFPGKITYGTGGYRLDLAPGGSLSLVLNDLEVDDYSANRTVPLENLRTRFSGAEFSAKQAGEALGISKRSANRLLSEAAQDGILTVIGRGPKTRYKIPA